MTTQPRLSVTDLSPRVISETQTVFMSCQESRLSNAGRKWDWRSRYLKVNFEAFGCDTYLGLGVRARLFTYVLGDLDEGEGILGGLCWQGPGAEGRGDGGQTGGGDDFSLNQKGRTNIKVIQSIFFKGLFQTLNLGNHMKKGGFISIFKEISSITASAKSQKNIFFTFNSYVWSQFNSILRVREEEFDHQLILVHKGKKESHHQWPMTSEGWLWISDIISVTWNAFSSVFKS